MKSTDMSVKKIKFIASVTFWGALLLAFLLAAAGSVQAQRSGKKRVQRVRQKPIVLTSVKSRGKKDRILESERRRGRFKPRPRGGDDGCRTELKNNTNYRIDVYINGRLIGSASARGVYSGMVNFGINRFYARTDLVTNNNYYYWGPNAFYCSARQGDAPIRLVINSKK